MVRIFITYLILATFNPILNAQCWKSISCVEDVSFAIKEDGTLWAWGFNTGRMGFKVDASGPIYLKPTRGDSSSDWRQVFAGRDNSFAIKTDGSLWACGRNDYGQLGIGTNSITYTYEWTKIPSEIAWLKVSQGQNFNIGLKIDGSIWGWGYNRQKVLGDGTNIDKNLPTKIGNENDWLDIATNVDYTIALKKDGTIWGWGQNDQGLLGDGTKIDQPIPVKIGNYDSFKNISSGLLFQLLLKNDGSLWGWGGNYYGELNDGSNITKKSIVKSNYNKVWKKLFNSSKSYSAGAVSNQGELFLWGTNLEGQLGNGDYNLIQPPFQLMPQYKWESLCFSTTHGLYLTEDGYLFASGNNLYGQLGDGTTVSKNKPINVQCEIINNNSLINNTTPTMYPNPVHGKLTIENIDLNENYKVKLIGNLNNVLFSSELKENEIDLANYNSGIYILHVFNKNVNYKFKILKQ